MQLENDQESAFNTKRSQDVNVWIKKLTHLALALPKCQVRVAEPAVANKNAILLSLCIMNNDCMP